MKKQPFISIFLLFISFNCFAHTDGSPPQCIHFTLTYSELNIPQTRLNINGHEIDIVIDLGMQTPLSLDEKVIQSINSSNIDYRLINHSDLSGTQSQQKQGMLPEVTLNGNLFHRVAFTIAKPWGLWINTKANQHTMPINTLGRDFFLNYKGILHYSRKNKQLTWYGEQVDKVIPQDKNILWQPLRVNDEGIHLTFLHQDKPLTFILDSAATITLIKPYPWLKLGDLQTGSLDLKFNHKNIETLVYQYPLPNNFQADGLIGDSFFQQTDVFIDTIHQQIGLEF